MNMEKIKAFFTNKWTQLVMWILWILTTVGLIIGGATAEVLNSGVALVIGVVQAVLLVIGFIVKQIKK